MPLTKISDKVADFCWEGIFQYQPQPTDGPLEFTVTGGFTSDNVNWFDVPQTTVTLADGTSNAVALFYESGVIDLTANQTSLNYTLLYRVNTAGGVITSIEDVRTHYKQRKLTIFVSDLAIDDYTAQMFDIGGYFTWLYPRENTISNGYIQDLGTLQNPAKLTGNPANYSFEAGPGAASLPGIRIKRASGVGNTDLECFAFNKLIAVNIDTGIAGSEGDEESGGIGYWIYIDADDLTGAPHYLHSMLNDSATNVWQRSSVESDGSVRGVFTLNATASTVVVRSNTGLISPRTWHQIIFRRRPGGQMQVFVDGTEQTDLATSGVDRDAWWRQHTVISRGSDCFDFGGAHYGWNGSAIVNNQSGVTHNADIVFAGMHLWWGNAALTATQISNLYTLGLGG